MTFSMQNIEQFTLAEMKDFIEGNQHLRPQVEGPQQAVYQLMERILKAQQYRKLSKGERGVVRGFLAKVTDLGRAQVTRLISRWMKTRRIGPGRGAVGVSRFGTPRRTSSCWPGGVPFGPGRPG